MDENDEIVGGDTNQDGVEDDMDGERRYHTAPPLTSVATVWPSLPQCPQSETELEYVSSLPHVFSCSPRPRLVPFFWASTDAAVTPTPAGADGATLSPDAAPGDTLAPVAGGGADSVPTDTTTSSTEFGNNVDAEDTDGVLATAALPSGAVYTGVLAVMVAVTGGMLL